MCILICPSYPFFSEDGFLERQAGFSVNDDDGLVVIHEVVWRLGCGGFFWCLVLESDGVAVA